MTRRSSPAAAAAFLLTLALPLICFPRLSAAQEETQQLLDDVVRDRARAEALAAERSVREEGLLAEVRAIDSRLLNAGRKRQALQDDEADLEEEYALHLQRIDRIQAEYERARSLLSKRLTSIYKRGRLGSNRVLLQAAASSEPLRMARYLAAVSRSDSTLLGDYETVRRRHESALRELDDRKAGLAEKKDLLERERALYEKARADKTVLLASLEKDSDADRSRREELLAIENELREILESSALPSQSEEEGRAQAEDADRNSGGDAVSSNSDPTRRGRPRFGRATLRPRRRTEYPAFENMKGELAAPVRGEVLSTYGQKRASGRVQQGVLVRAGGDMQVASVAGGEIVFSGPFPGLGNTIIINHGDRFHTVYAQLDVLQHEVGERVRANEVVGTLAGSEPVLHFELRAQGKAVDPTAWFAGGYSAFGR